MKWAQSTNGKYFAYIDMLEANYAFPSGEYEICFGNGDQSSLNYYSEFVGEISLIGLTTEPVSTTTLTAGVGDVFSADYDLTLRSGSYVCGFAYAYGTVETVDINLAFDNGSPSGSYLLTELSVGINYLNSAVGDCIQIGGAAEKCNHLYSWPITWENASSGNYVASIDVRDAAYSWPFGEYEICFGQSDQSDNTYYSTFIGGIALPGLTVAFSVSVIVFILS